MILFSRLRRPLGAYICEQCRAQTFAGSQWRGLSSNLPRETHTREEKFVRRRIEQLGGAASLAQHYPRWKRPPDIEVMDASNFQAQWSAERQADTSKGQTIGNNVILLYGRVKSRRSSGSKLLFFDLESGQSTVQSMVNYGELQASQDKALPLEDFQKGLKNIQRGDWIAVTGLPYLTDSGQISILAQALPQVISVSLQPVPTSVTNKEFLSRNRHVERIINRAAADSIMLRHCLTRALREFFDQRKFVEVTTPLFMAGVGGAAARPFETEAFELGQTTLNLRIAPELFLKRLVVGNMDRVYEIGPAFRNEGVDMNHNPEFTICEFYQVLADLDSLIETTEAMFAALKSVIELSRPKLCSVPDPATLGLEQPFCRRSFIPTLEAAIRTRVADWQFPDTSMPTARDLLLVAAKSYGLEIEEASSPALILDTLFSKIVEPQLNGPTWITHHPACMSPLAKSFTPAGSIHPVSARAELFIRGQEYVNCYEEENSPIEQRRKFEDQLQARGSAIPTTVDEDYLRALEWGLPPTGGWGCGIDRLVMLFSGKKRIADVLPFGTVNNVAAMGS